MRWLGVMKVFDTFLFEKKIYFYIKYKNKNNNYSFLFEQINCLEVFKTFNIELGSDITMVKENCEIIILSNVSFLNICKKKRNRFLNVVKLPRFLK